MNNFKAVLISAAVCVLAASGVCLSDTFKNTNTGETLHGYAIHQTTDGQTSIYTQEKGLLKLNLGEWQVTRDKLGRNKKVIVLPVDDAIMSETVTAAFEGTVTAAADEGPLFILVEIDTPGGQVDLAQRMCAAIAKTTNCDVIAFITGGPNGGAISAGAAVALACKKIYMANNSIIGGAALITLNEKKDQIKDKSYGAVIDEKMSSIWRAYLASLAQQNHRPGLMARAMVDRNIVVMEVNEANKREFIDPMNKRPEQKVVRTWNKSGALLTLTANEAVDCTMADGLVNSRQELLQILDAADANVVTDKKIVNARREIQIVVRRAEEIRKNFDMKLKQLEYPQEASRAVGILRGVKSDLEELAGLAKKYPDLHLNTREVDDMLNSINAAYENAIRESKNHK